MTPITRSSRSRPAADRAELHRIAAALARAEGWEAAGPPVADPGGGVSLRVTGTALHEPALLRVRERRPGDAPFRAELASRKGAASEHVVGVVHEAGHRRVRGREVDGVLFADTPGGTLEELIDRRGRLSGGEAATVLLGVAGGLGALHAAGWAAPTLTPDGVVFTTDGCPALGLLSEVVELRPEAAVADAEAYHALARWLCLRVADGTGMRLLSAIEGALRSGRWHAVEEAVAGVARPVAVRLEAVGAGVAGVSGEPPERGPETMQEPQATGDPAERERLGVRRTAGRRRDRHGSGEPARRRHGGSGVTHAPGDSWARFGARVAAAIDLLDGHPVRAVGRRLAALVRRRPALAIAGGLPVLLALVVVAFTPGTAASTIPTERATAAEGMALDTGAPSGSDPRDGSAASGHDASSGGRDGSVDAGASGPVSSGGAGGSSSSTPPTGDARPDPSAEVTGASDGGSAAAGRDDPIAAARALLEARHACFDTTPTRPGCLEAVLDADGGFRAGEEAVLGRPGASDERDYAGADLTLVERWGDAALVAVVPDDSRTPKSEPASLLLVRSEAGWRLRAVFP